MTIAEKTKKLLEYSLILKAQDKKSWAETLPKMTENQVKTLYDVLSSEVSAWKKEGISIIPDLAVEMQLMPEEHGASINALKARLEGKAGAKAASAAPSKPNIPQPEPKTPFGKELQREVNTPELSAPAGNEPDKKPEDQGQSDEEGEAVYNRPEADIPKVDSNAWMLSNKVVVPKAGPGVIKPSAKSVPRVRNRVSHSGLDELKDIRTIDDLSKIEAAHLRQGPLQEQLAFIRQRFNQLARESDELPINIIPVFERSPLFQLYLTIGSKMIEKNTGDDRVSLDQVTAEMEAGGEETLTQEEFEAVADFKKDLEAMAGL